MAETTGRATAITNIAISRKRERDAHHLIRPPATWNRIGNNTPGEVIVTRTAPGMASHAAGSDERMKGRPWKPYGQDPSGAGSVLGHYPGAASFLYGPLFIYTLDWATTSGTAMEKVLVIEDDRAIRKALTQLFEGEGYSVEAAEDGAAGLATFHASSPSLIILDLALPKMSGRDLCREIRRQSPSIRIIILSAASEEVDKVLLLELGADDYVTKPFSPKELLARVRAVVRRAEKKLP